MARSDYSSDPDDGSITSDGEHDRDIIGPTSPTTQKKQKAPWHPSKLDTSNIPSRQASGASSARSPIQYRPLAFSGTPMTGPNAKFRTAVNRVIQINKMKSLTGTSADMEPGVDPRRDSAQALYGSIHQRCSIQIVDFGPSKSKFTQSTNERLENDLLFNGTKARPLFSKVRWICIGGISWDVVKTLGLHYNIHPLAIEDIIHGHRKPGRSKSDHYSNHLFVRVTSLTLREDNKSSTPSPSSSTTLVGEPRAASPLPIEEEDGKVKSDSEEEAQPKRFGLFRRKTAKSNPSGVASLAGAGLFGAQAVGGGGGDMETAWAKTVNPELNRSPTTGSKDYKAVADRATVNALKKGERVEVDAKNIYIILFRDGTLISIHQDPDTQFFDPILSRLRQSDTLLRNAADASLLLQSIIDLVVDKAVMMVDRYHKQILSFEKDILIHPKMKTVRWLHIASGDLSSHKRILSPIKSLVYGLRRYDLDRAIAQANSEAPGYDPKKIEGFLTHKSKIYLADVMDHMEYILSSLDMFETISENLISYTFNLVAYETNETMRGLTLATVIFLPITFLTGYFGMNFDPFPAVNNNTDLYFWKIALPMMAFVIIAFTWPDVSRGMHFLKKRAVQKRYQGAEKARSPPPP